jgi:hypothetical protein
MNTQKSDPDPFECEIICELHALDPVKRGEWKTGRWTREVKNAVGRVAEKRGYSVCATGCNHAKWGEWLYDLTCIEYDEEQHLKGIPLVMESEWQGKGVNYDFQKLVVARADCRVMVLEVKSDKNKEEVIQQLLQHVRKCRHSTKGDRYLFACWNSVRRSFDCSVHIVIG